MKIEYLWPLRVSAMLYDASISYSEGTDDLAVPGGENFFWNVPVVSIALTHHTCFSPIFLDLIASEKVTYMGFADFIKKGVGNDNFRAALFADRLTRGG